MNNLKIYLRNKTIRTYFFDATKVSQEIISTHDASPYSSFVLATAVSTFGMLSAFFDNSSETISTYSTNGMVSKVIVETFGNKIRAKMNDFHIGTEFDKDRYNEIPIELGIGKKGSTKVLRKFFQVNNKNIEFFGESELLDSNITSDLANYFKKSEQAKTVVLCSVKFNENNPKTMEKSYGIIMQLLPNHTDEDIGFIDSFRVNKLIQKLSKEEIIKKIDGEEIGSKNLEYSCKCSWSYVHEVSQTINKKQRNEIIHEDGFIELGCPFCSTKYQFKEEDFTNYEKQTKQ